MNAAKQVELTRKFLLPALPELQAFFLAVRTAVDPIGRHVQPEKMGKPYPLGQCLEITLVVQKLLRRLDKCQLAPAAVPGFVAFSAFLAAGGEFRHVWGDLRGEFFQNAFQLGTLYVDVANDSVTTTKPKVEIVPFTDAQLTPIADFRHFARVATHYWQERTYPNHVLPELAPYFPLVHVNAHGKVILREFGAYMIELARARQFSPSEDMLRDAAMPADVFGYVASALAETRTSLAVSPAEGRVQALGLCREYRNKRWHTSTIQTRKIALAAEVVNNRLKAQPGLPDLYASSGEANLERMATIKIQTC